MKGKRTKTAEYLRSTAPVWLLSIAVAFLGFFLISISPSGTKVQNFGTTRKIERNIASRLSLLDSFVRNVIDEDVSRQEITQRLPSDMVIYLYEADSLSFWAGIFQVDVDDLAAASFFPVLDHTSNFSGDAIRKIGEEYVYTSIGGKWYIAYSTLEQGKTVIAALEIESLARGFSPERINTHIIHKKSLSFVPITEDQGFEIRIPSRLYPEQQIPIFKVCPVNSTTASSVESSLSLCFKCLFIIFVVCFFMLNLRRNPSGLSLLMAMAVTIAGALGLMTIGSNATHSLLFSPMLYASGDLLSSLGAMCILNLTVALLAGCICSQKGFFEASIQKCHRRFRSWCLLILTILMIVALGAYLHLMLRSLILNSNISFNLAGMGRTTIYYAFAILTLILLFCSIFHTMSLARVPLSILFGFRKDVRSMGSLFIFASIAAIYLTTAQSLLGKQKEENRIAVWANMLSINRDLKLEIMLKSVEPMIENDEVLANLIQIEGSDNLVRTYLIDHYFSRLQDPYLFTVSTSTSSPEKISNFFNKNAHSYTPIAPMSKVMFLDNGITHSSYAAAFAYPSLRGNGNSWLLMEFRQRQGYDESIYPKLLSGSSISDRVSLPAQYSYARYIDNRLIDSGGLFAYPTYVDEYNNPFSDGRHITVKDGYVHHRHFTGDSGEVIYISRAQRNAFTFVLDFVYALLIILIICLVFSVKPAPRPKKPKRKAYFRRRINYVIVAFLLMGLVTMSVVSVYFVYNRNEKNLRTLMSDKIVTIRSMLEAKVFNFNREDIFSDASFREDFAEIALNARTDLSLYSPSGRVFLSTNQEVFERMIIPSRIESEAYYQITVLHQRYYIATHRYRGDKYYFLYTPLQNVDGDVLAIVCAPYTSENYSFMEDAFSHASAIASLFLILIGLSAFVSRNTVRSLFRPLVVMGLRMTRAQNEGLKEIVYNRDDEIKSIVDSYNLMVRELDKSTKLLAESERDKAWSEMARQVAHEIKNPLTPIKLEIQRLMRARARGDESWGEKFEPAMNVILQQIDILADTANEFSTFAKLYTQESTRFDIDTELSNLIGLFDNRAGVKIEYLGMKDTWVVAPKPQILRVFVNLLNNAIQAVENRQEEGLVYVSLRQSVSMQDAVDIVFDDNGPGVSEENVAKLFTPNFTTKSSGTGLGLAICHSIITKCGGTISYSRSFTLSGACFTVVLPKNNVNFVS